MSKCILCLAVFIAGLTVLDRKQTQSNIAKTLGHVTHDELNRLPGIIQDMFQHIVMSVIPRYRTKNQPARFVYWVVRHNIPFSYLTFDNWYASKQNMRFFNGLGIKFVTRLRVTWIIYSNIEKKVSELINCECHHYGKLNAYVKRFLVKYPGFDMGYLAIVKKDKHDEPGRTKYLFTNELSLTNTEIVLRYRSRWHIEIFFRTCKQYFGFSACQAQMMPQVIHHFRMVFFAWSSLLTH